MMLVLSFYFDTFAACLQYFNPLFYMQVFVYLYSIEMYIYAIYYGK
nr:MAG TPA: hypothetical protein [Caudoviricetes sp.]